MAIKMFICSMVKCSLGNAKLRKTKKGVRREGIIMHSQWLNKRSSMALKFVALHKVAILIVMMGSQDTRQLYIPIILQGNVLKGLYFAEILRVVSLSQVVLTTIFVYLIILSYSKMIFFKIVQ